MIVICSNKSKSSEIAGFPAFVRNSDYIVTFGHGLIGVDNCPDYSTKKVYFTNPNYDCPSTSNFIDFKNYAALDNDHDAIQVRNKNAELVHALYWTNEYQEKDNPKAVNIASLLPLNTVRSTFVQFEGEKDWFNLTNFGVSLTGDPGRANNSKHQKLRFLKSYYGNLKNRFQVIHLQRFTISKIVLPL